jgi:polyisoprenoid-binding protein YceI
VTGKMTIKGISNEISFPATITNTGKEIRAKAKITLDRTKWDIRYGSGKFFEGLGDKIIHDDFVIELDMVANS